ncbi:MAG: MarR family winged helix-turn-helix transcriptional regulator [Clostridiales bacterium]|nr:MarR family winged helix-turn-helix transcriptional regulator [Clostridiales bacterium]
MQGVHYRINLIKGRFASYILKRAQEAGLSPGQPRVLEYLATDDGCAQSAICEAWELDRSTVAGLVKRMERDGLIRTEQAHKDKRKKRLWLTPKGSRLWSEMTVYIERMDETAFHGFSPAEKEQFMKLLDRMYENLKHLNEDGTEETTMLTGEVHNDGT